MRDHELELIAALVEGRLDDETEARALIDSAPRFREEYEAQKLAYDTLKNLNETRLSESERAALHRDVWTDLRQRSSPPRRWYRWVPVTAGMGLVLVGLVAVLGRGGDDAGVFTETAADLAGSVTTSIAERAAGDADEAGGDGAETFGETTDSTEAAAETPPAEEAGSFYAGEAERARSGEFSPRMDRLDAASNAEFDACLEDADLVGYLVLALLDPPEGLVAGDSDSPILVAVPEGAELADATVAFVASSTCQVVHLDE